MENIEIINGVPVDWIKYKGGSLAKSKKAYVEFCELLHNNGHALESDYTKNSIKVIVDFNCGHEPHLLTPHNYKKGNRCPKCNGNCPEQAKENFIKLINDNGHKLMSEYNGMHKKVLIDYNCGHKPHWVKPSNYKHGNGCPKCSGSCPEQAREFFMEVLKENGHKLLSEYKGTHEKVLIDYLDGSDPYWIYPNSYKNGRKCLAKCSDKAKEEFFSALYSSNHILLSDYKNTNIKVLIDFKCGHEPHWITPGHYKSGRGCPKCANNTKSQGEEELMKLLETNGHILLSKYVDAHTKVLIDFNCGHKPNLTKPNSYKNGARCPECSGNKGESELHNLLIDMGYEVKTQHKYDDLRDKRLLPYDFYLPKYNLLIELDGEHHRQEIYYKSKNDITDMDEVDAYLRLCDRQHKDKLKDDYARENNIPLLRIEYNSKIELDKWKQLILDKINEIELQIA
jgi:hypothetical protein